MGGMTLETRLLIELADLKSIQFVCKKCGARATRDPKRAADAIPATCGQCRTPWHDGDDTSALVTFLRTLAALRQGTGEGCAVILEVDGRLSTQH
jgi:hypothetical protein